MARRTVAPRPALVTDVMMVLQRRRNHAVPIRQWVLEARLPSGLYGFLDALRGCQERHLLTLDDRLPGRAGRAVRLTAAGIDWAPREDGQPVPLVYTWRHHGKPVLGPLADWAATWAVDAHPVSGGPLGWTLAGEQHNAYLPHINPAPGGWYIVAAGEQVAVSADDRKELSCLN